MSKNHDRNSGSPQDAEVPKGGIGIRKTRKPAYEAPVVLALGELARGSGLCTDGSGDSEVCANGSLASVGFCETGSAGTQIFCSPGSSPIF